MKILLSLSGDRTGAVMLEYGLVAILVVLVIVGLVAVIGQDILGMFYAAVNNFPPSAS
ncbi:MULTISPECIES: hypothetical protein [Nguyenibacter]|uniref:Pilus assembly protein Flp/PilA n=1 Tax=Nguyenibacter vanlangensis TaxID=1216886 RepID=A0A7Y7M4L5_9PROT|nr:MULTISPECIES: hypothetical protein [Nguyenibacter]NVN10960.1 hypothetical protein [Nguyenibacter vanlangensis]WRH89213.1 hypothetical protein QN315_06280 [Nguyenibacter sp. L1]